MAAALALRADFTGAGLRALARSSRDGNQVRRLLALAAIYEGGTRSDAARLGGVGLQTVRDWVLRFNATGPDGLVDTPPPGGVPLLDEAQRRALAQIVESGPIAASHGVVRWRLIDLAQWVWDEFEIAISKQTLSRELRTMGYRKLSARPRHHAQDDEAIPTFKNVWPAPSARALLIVATDRSASTYTAYRHKPLPRWRAARPKPHKLHGIECHILNQAVGTSVYRQAIFKIPPADISWVSRRCRR